MTQVIFFLSLFDSAIFPLKESMDLYQKDSYHLWHCLCFVSKFTNPPGWQIKCWGVFLSVILTPNKKYIKATFHEKETKKQKSLREFTQTCVGHSQQLPQQRTCIMWVLFIFLESVGSSFCRIKIRHSPSFVSSNHR